jgi:cobalt transporter subunit CbtB
MSNSTVNTTLAVQPNLVTDSTPHSSAAASARKWPAIVAIALGAVVIFGVGFGSGIAHNAAHDTRHALIFPCH